MWRLITPFFLLGGLNFHFLMLVVYMCAPASSCSACSPACGKAQVLQACRCSDVVVLCACSLHYGVKLEQDRFQNRTPDFIYMLLFSMVALLVLALSTWFVTLDEANYIIAIPKVPDRAPALRDRVALSQVMSLLLCICVMQPRWRPVPPNKVWEAHILPVVGLQLVRSQTEACQRLSRLQQRCCRGSCWALS